MNLRHGVALTLVGWYLLAPPTLDPRTQNASLFVDPSAPLFRWDRLATYASKAKCQLARRDRLFHLVKAAEEDEHEAAALAREAAMLTRQQPFDSEKADALSFQVLLALYKEQAVQQEVMSRCIAGDDPGLAK